jgi:hypothetical protein
MAKFSCAVCITCRPHEAHEDEVSTGLVRHTSARRRKDMNSRLSALRSIVPHINLTTVLDATRAFVQQMIGHDDGDRSGLHFAASKTYRKPFTSQLCHPTVQYCANHHPSSRMSARGNMAVSLSRPLRCCISTYWASKSHLSSLIDRIYNKDATEASTFPSFHKQRPCP